MNLAYHGFLQICRDNMLSPLAFRVSMPIIYREEYVPKIESKQTGRQGIAMGWNLFRKDPETQFCFVDDIEDRRKH